MLVVHAERDASDVVILDAMAFSDVPVATISVPVRVPFGFTETGSQMYRPEGYDDLAVAYVFQDSNGTRRPPTNVGGVLHVLGPAIIRSKPL